MNDKVKEDLKEILKEDFNEQKKNQEEDLVEEEKNVAEEVEVEGTEGEEALEDLADNEDLSDKLNETLLKVADLEAEKDKYLRNLQMERADFDNFRKRNKMAVSEAMSAAKADIIFEILPVVDNFERALSADLNREDAFVKGMELVLTQLYDILKKAGLKETPALGEKFDPHFHEAVMAAPCEEGIEPHTITEVFSKGYMLGDKVVRYSKVKVSE
ncbi:MAG: nucleotide exchange factor GrpE [Eubacteriales bacterium]